MATTQVILPLLVSYYLLLVQLLSQLHILSLYHWYVYWSFSSKPVTLKYSLLAASSSIEVLSHQPGPSRSGTPSTVGKRCQPCGRVPWPGYCWWCIRRKPGHPGCAVSWYRESGGWKLAKTMLEPRRLNSAISCRWAMDQWTVSRCSFGTYSMLVLLAQQSPLRLLVLVIKVSGAYWECN